MAELKAFKEEMKEEIVQASIMNMQSSHDEDLGGSTGPSHRAVRSEDEVAGGGRSLLDEESVHIILTMIETMLYLNEEAQALYQLNVDGAWSHGGAQGEAQHEAEGADLATQ